MPNPKPASNLHLTASAAVIRRLGDQLIRHPRAAFFELVKNAYDADATDVTILIRTAGPSDGRIEIRDDGSGMSQQDIAEKWCRLAGENKVSEPYTSKYGRRRLGAKGIGRFSAAKLGDRLKLTTRQAGDRTQTTVQLDFSECTDQRDLQDISIRHLTGTPRKNFQSGTIVQIDSLRDRWGLGEIRALRRDLETLIDPEDSDQTFRIVLKVPERPNLSGPLSHPSRGQESHRVEFELDREGRAKIVTLTKDRRRSRTARVDPPSFGPVRGSLRYFAEGVAARQRKIGGAKEDTHMGVKVYRDKCRVRPYGEPGNDWLGLAGKRPDSKPWALRRQAIAGSIHIGTAENPRLTDASDRESGMDHNTAFQEFVTFIRTQLVSLDEMVSQEGRSRARREEARARQHVLDDLARCLGQLQSPDFVREVTSIDRRRRGEAGATTQEPGPRVQDHKPPDKIEWVCLDCGLVWRVLKSGAEPERCMDHAVDRSGALRRTPGCGSDRIERTRRRKKGPGTPAAPTPGAYAAASVGGSTLHLVISDDMGENEEEFVFDERTITINGNHKAYRTAHELDLAARPGKASASGTELPAVRTHCAKCACLAWARFHYQRSEDFEDFDTRYAELLDLFCDARTTSGAA